MFLLGVGFVGRLFGIDIVLLFGALIDQTRFNDFSQPAR